MAFQKMFVQYLVRKTPSLLLLLQLQHIPLLCNHLVLAKIFGTFFFKILAFDFSSAKYPKYETSTFSPTITRSCNCLDCVLQPTPTKQGSCEAICAEFDDRTAVGVQTFTYSTLAPSKAGGSCTTTSVISCAKKCRCQYTSSIEGDCAFTSINYNVFPHVEYGEATALMLGPLSTWHDDNYNCFFFLFFSTFQITITIFFRKF
jgi:hypothetical protein